MGLIEIEVPDGVDKNEIKDFLEKEIKNFLEKKKLYQTSLSAEDKKLLEEIKKMEDKDFVKF